MCKQLLFFSFALAVLCEPDLLYAQFTDPHTYDNTPVGVNQLELVYAHVRANSSIDTSLIITGAKLNLNQGTIRYTRYFGLVRRLVWLQANVPLAGLNGSVTGTDIRRSISGASDSSYEMAALLKGGTPLSAAQFANYKPATTVGLSATITAPTGQYNPNKLLNLGSDRWSFKPEIAVSHPFGPEQRWQLDAYANAYFFTDNTSYRGAEILQQDALPGLEIHTSYSFISSLWASVDARYSFRGTTFVNGANQNDAQENFILGTEANVSINAQHSLVFEFGKVLVHRNGPAFSAFAVKYDYIWGNGYR